MKLKWTIHELIKKATNDNYIDAKLDLRKYLREDFIDLVDIFDTSVTGDFTYHEVDEVFTFNLNIKTTLIMLCSITLEEIPVNLDFTSQLNFSVEFIDDDTHVIEGITLDIEPYIFSEIIIEKPMKIISSGAYEKYHEEIEELTEEEIIESSPFARLKK
jgi:uncharacterized protein